MPIEFNPVEQLLAEGALMIQAGWWTKGPMAVDQFGEEVAVSHRGACRFCAVGSLHRRTQLSNHPFGFAYSEAHSLLCEAADEVVPDTWLAERGDEPAAKVFFNDHPDTTREEVLATFERARELSRLDEDEREKRRREVRARIRAGRD